MRPTINISLEEYNILISTNELFNKLYDSDGILFRTYQFNNKTLNIDYDNHYIFITKDQGLKEWEFVINKKHMEYQNKLNNAIQDKEEIINSLLKQIDELKQNIGSVNIQRVKEKQQIQYENMNLIQFIKSKYL